MDKKKLIVIGGPTASGKTDLAFQIAKRLKAEIISADSRQIYKKLDIGTAKPDQKTLKEIPHHLIDIIDVDKLYSAGDFALDAQKIITNLSQKEIPTIVTGGTGLYIKSLVDGITKTPDINDSVKKTVEIRIIENGLEKCFQELIKLEPRYENKLHINDIARITRGLELYHQTQKSIFDYQDENESTTFPCEITYLAIDWDKEILYERINKRVLSMFEIGLIDEVENILKLGYNPKLPALKTIGYKETIEFLTNNITKDEMILNIQKKSRLYAKKQLTWFRKDKRIKWLNPNNSFTEASDLINKFLNG